MTLAHKAAPATLAVSSHHVVELIAGKTYKLTYSMDLSADAVSYSGLMEGTSDSWNSFGLGGDFWDVVSGTASLESLDGAQQYIPPTVPLPPAALLFGTALIGLLGIVQRTSKRPKAL